ncbi:MAG: hypothetical protein FD123_680 [Bacteroidetes bacterium]|nr:MAG: hypothetical protein FD123_680 [Bacteroidota bacterium]
MADTRKRDPRASRRTTVPNPKQKLPNTPGTEHKLNPFFTLLSKRRSMIVLAVANLLLFTFAFVDYYGPKNSSKEKLVRVDPLSSEFITAKSHVPISEDHHYSRAEFIGQDLIFYRTMTGSPVAYSIAADTSGKLFEPFHHRYSYLELVYLNGIIGIALILLRAPGKTEVRLMLCTAGIILFMVSVFVLLFN